MKTSLSAFLLVLLVAMFGVGTGGTEAYAKGFTRLGQDIESRPDTLVALDGHFRVRSEWLHNLDLDRGLDPAGDPLYPIPLSDPTSQLLTHSDMRLRTDLSLYAPVGDVAVKLRVDVFDNLAFGSTPAGPPQSTFSQSSGAYLNVERVYAEALTPFGLLTVGRMGSDWGLGMFTNGGDCLDCDSGDVADRIGFIMPTFGHIWALAYDLAFRGPITTRPDDQRTLDLDPSDNVQALTLAVLRYRTPRSIERRRRAGKVTFDYGMYVSYRWQENDVPAWYVPARVSPPIDSQQVVFRGQHATAADLWARLDLPWGRIEAEAALIQATIEQASLLPGVVLEPSLDSTQFGAALETEFGAIDWPVRFGVDAGFASGDAAPGFGAFPQPYDAPAQPGQLDGPQSNIPSDTEVNNFRFHPDYRVDRILFREIIGTVTDAAYVRPHVAWDFAHLGPGTFSAGLSAISSWAVEPTSTPSGSRYLGLEIDPTLAYTAYDTFVVSAEYAAYFPGAAFDNPREGLEARAAQLFRLRMGFGF